MRTEIKIAIIVAVLLIVLLVIMKMATSSRTGGHSLQTSDDHSKSRDDTREERHWSQAASNSPLVETPPVLRQIPNSPSAPVANSNASLNTASSNVPSAPTLRCYDYFEFPGEGVFHVKTCSGPSGQVSQSSPTKNSKPTRIFLQWFPVENVESYKVYCSQGPSVSTAPGGHLKSWPVAGNSYYFESEPLDGNSCWSMVVTAINKDGNESAPSATYTTCAI